MNSMLLDTAYRICMAPLPPSRSVQMFRRGDCSIFLAIAFIASMVICPMARAQSNEWAWVNGTTTTDSSSVYGSIGTAAPGNTPGTRLSSATWSDKNGNLWLFGGEPGVGANCLSDLWEFSTSINQWKWVDGPEGIANQTPIYGTKGAPAVGNTPGARCTAFTWTDATGNLWLFGGSISVAGVSKAFSDLWEFSPTTSEWTWISGSSSTNQPGVYGTLGTPAAGNMPGARGGNINWVDGQGNLWLFGGEGFDSAGVNGGLSDLWKFNPSNGTWTWVNGPDTGNQPAVTGTQGVPAVGNVPSSRTYNVGWIDKKGNFWIFGGNGPNDLWEYNPATNEWAWISGVTTIPAPGYVPFASGNYGTFGIAAAGNTPSGRTGAVGWTDSAGNLWLFGGVGMDATNSESFLNDLWEFNLSTNQWAWMGGSSVAAGSCPTTASWCGQPGVYGTQLTSELGAIPGGRYDGESWTDNNGNFWLLGGIGIDQDGNGGYLNDLWEFQPNSGSVQVTATPSLSLASGTYTTWQTLTISDATPGASIAYVLNGKLPPAEYSGPLTVSSSETIQAIASASGHANSNLATASYTLNLPAASAPQFNLPSGSYAAPQTVSITDSMPGAIIYYAIGGVPTGAFNIYTGPISVSTSEQIQAFAVADNYASSNAAFAEYNIGPLPATTNMWAWMNGSISLASPCYPSGNGLTSCARPGWYGTLGQPAMGNTPGGRNTSAGWIDNSGNLWLFGGIGYDGAGTSGLLNDLWKYDPSKGEWTWMGGSAIIGNSCPAQVTNEYCGKPGVYGTQGAPATSNVPGGREWPTYWTDKNGHFWLFGGEGFDANGVLGYLNDLWEFDPSTDEWTWMSGQNAFPGLFGGFAGNYGIRGTPSPQNWPGSRWYTTSWVDLNDHLWMYGGEGQGAVPIWGFLEDLWEYDPSTNEWTWRNGLQFPPDSEGGWVPVSSGIGETTPLDSPGSRSMSEGWADSSGHLWLFSGWNTDPSADSYLEDDQWAFDASVNQWTLIGYGGGLPVYGTMGTPGPGNVPSSCPACSMWTDTQGKFWLLGGEANSSGIGPVGNVRDLWWFSPSTDEWTWMGGTTTTQGIYGLPGVPDARTSPSARTYGVSWTGKDGNLWLFGGAGTDADNGIGFLNDLWVYELSGPPATPALQIASPPTFSLAAGNYSSIQTVTISDAVAGAMLYYTTDGSTPNAYSRIYAGQISVTASETIQAVAVANGYINSQPSSVSYVINLPATATPTFGVAAGTYTSAQTVSLSDATSGASIYFTTDGTTPTTSSAQYTAPISVTKTETIQAIAIATGYSSSPIASATYTINLPATFTVSANPSALTVYAANSGSVSLTIAPQNGFNSTISFSCSGLPSGVTCSFSPTTITPSVSATTTQLTFTASAQAGLTQQDSQSFFPGGTFVALAGLIGVLSRLRKRALLTSLVLVMILAPLIGCGGGGSANGGGTTSTPTTSIITVMATSSTVQQSTTVTLTLN